MAKDPAMLWYWADWNSGTTTLSRFLKGCYMDLLHAQFNSGHLSLEEIKTVLGSDFGQSWPTLQKKFTVDQAGKYFNERLELEKVKRANYTASRKKNLKSSHKGKHINKHMQSHMDNVNEDGNTIVIDLKKKESENLFEPLSEEWFTSIFDEGYLESLAMTYRGIDISDMLSKFKVKVRGSPSDYRHRDTGGIRNAFLYRLDQSKPTKNGQPQNIIEDRKRKFEGK